MQNNKRNVFLEKFRLLNSQEHAEEINWTSSGSSDYENTSTNNKLCNVNSSRKMKRKRKKKLPKNASNLSITILDTSRNSKKHVREEKSPILCSRRRRKSASQSPILKPSQGFLKNTAEISPILIPKTALLKSPILVPKTKSPISAVKVRKKLFNMENNTTNSTTVQNENFVKNEDLSYENVKKEDEDIVVNGIITCQSIIKEKFDENEHGNSQNAKLNLLNKVKAFFDSHFSSDTTSLASQNSISDVLTPKNSTKTSDDVEIFTCKKQVENCSQPLKQETSNSSENSQYNFNKNSKKIRYKKGGLAYRLNTLLKKQNASLSLWQHERFLAANSNFVIPKEECRTFRIQKVNFKYGCHVLETVDSNDEKFVILINSIYVSDNIVSDTVLKLYEPYKILQLENYSNFIINVCKYECIDYLTKNN